jgi:hypothetical protein
MDNLAAPAEYYYANNSRKTGFAETRKSGIMIRFYWKCGWFPLRLITQASASGTSR